ncbi:MAG: hypothetical protein PHV34_00790 [Verrucomicrobiae bacterium]|nr:hypothetical protein [Verrucomicrobiae bacterium]
MIEISLALAVIGIGLVSVIGVMPHLLNSSRQSVEASEVALAAQGFIDADYSGAITPSELADYTGVFETNIAASLSFSASNSVAYVTATNGANTAEYSSGGNPLLKTVIITYAWPPNAKKRQVFTFITEVAATKDIPVN